MIDLFRDAQYYPFIHTFPPHKRVLFLTMHVIRSMRFLFNRGKVDIPGYFKSCASNEPTASLDAQSEKEDEVYKQFSQISEGRTTC